MKLLLYFIGFLCCYAAQAQRYGQFFDPADIREDTSQTSVDADKSIPALLPNCRCLPPSMFQFDENGHHILPADHPSAKYYNDPKHWYWKHVSETNPEFGGFWEVKPEYMDSIPDGRGGWIKAAFWTIERWKQEELEEEERKKNQPQDEYLRFNWPIIIPKDTSSAP